MDKITDFVVKDINLVDIDLSIYGGFVKGQSLIHQSFFR